MQLTQAKQNRIFWILQIGGWLFVHLLSLILLKEVDTAFLVFNIVAGTVVGIVATTPLRYYLKRHIRFDRFGWRELLRILGACVAGALLMALLSFIAGYVFGRYFESDNEFVKALMQSYNKVWLLIINSLFFTFIWIACYLVIKLLLKLNRDRIERLELNDNLKQARLNTLKGQINPHFMFNSLNNIRGLMLEDVERARDMLTRLSEMLRYSLTKDQVDAISLDSELEMVGHYVDLSRIQFEDRLRYREEVNPDTRSALIPPMLVQLLIENAFKHGISRLKEGGEVFLRSYLKDRDLIIEVRNTGTLELGSNTTQLGLKNIRQRLRLLYGERAAFDLSQEGGEVLAVIKVPQT